LKFALVLTAVVSFVLAAIPLVALGVSGPYDVLVATMASAAATVIVWKGESAKARERREAQLESVEDASRKSMRVAISLRAMAALEPSRDKLRATAHEIERSPAFAVGIAVGRFVDVIALHNLTWTTDEYLRRKKSGDGTHEAFYREHEMEYEEREGAKLALKLLLLIPVLEDLRVEGLDLESTDVALHMMPFWPFATLAGDHETVRRKVTEPLERACGVARTIVSMTKPDEEHGDEKFQALLTVWDTFRLGLRSSDERFVTLLAEWYPHFVRDQYRPARVAWDLERASASPSPSER
jgi:hypothetical protein